MQIESPAFEAHQPIPARYTCDGENLSPPLRWTTPPANTKAFALICDDPDAPSGTWVHWVIYHIPSEARELPEGVKPQNSTFKQGTNDFGRPGYGGPCPPKGPAHRYFFKLYALDTPLPAQSTKAQLEKAMKGHILEEAELVGTHER